MVNKYDLTQINGIGERMARKIISNLGGEDELAKVVQNCKVDQLANIEGISQRKAIDIVNELLGNPAQRFLKTKRAWQLYEEIISKILEYTHTNHAQNKILLLAPTTDLELIQSRQKMVKKAQEMISDLPQSSIHSLLENLDYPVPIKPVFDASKAILVENQEDMDYLLERKFNDYYPIISSAESAEIQDYELVYYVYSSGDIELEESDNVIMVSIESDDIEIIPELVLNYFRTNHNILEKVLELRKILQKESVLEEVMEILRPLEELNTEEIDLDQIIGLVKEDADESLKNSIKNIDLKGEEILELLKEGIPPKIEKLFEDSILKARSTIKNKTHLDFDPFLPTYPLKIDQQEVERVKKREFYLRQIEVFEEKVKAARRLSSLKDRVEQEILEALEFDYEFALGCFAYHYHLQIPEIADEFYLLDALHLNLVQDASPQIQRIDYRLAQPDKVALLTGANSGGKTTLLETLAQISIMSQMGLPVSAKQARVKILDEIYFFSKKRSLDAGAFESFLQTFMPIVIKDSEKLILLDELEAITELEAAVKIISSFIEMIDDSDSFGVIVTHMAREIIKHSSVRVDGIEAKGLDNDYNLIVDRTPRMNYLARSTPELILKMIYERSDGKLKKLYGKILEKFQ